MKITVLYSLIVCIDGLCGYLLLFGKLRTKCREDVMGWFHYDKVIRISKNPYRLTLFMFSQ